MPRRFLEVAMTRGLPMQTAMRRVTCARWIVIVAALWAMPVAARAETVSCPFEGCLVYPPMPTCVWPSYCHLCGNGNNFFEHRACYYTGGSAPSGGCPFDPPEIDTRWYKMWSEHVSFCPTGSDPVEPPTTPPPPPNPGGPPCPPTSVGNPVSLTTGAMFFTHSDASVGELVVSRTFNTSRLAYASRYGAFGPGWNASFEGRLKVLNPRTIDVRLTDGSPQYYHDNNLDGVFEAVLPQSASSTLQAVTGGYRRTFRAGGQEDYDSAGRLLSATDPSGVATTYTRDGQGRLSSMTRLGRTVSVAYSGTSTRPEKVLGPGGVELARYTYDASNRLERVTYPDASGYRYIYDSSGRVVRVMDLAGKMIEAHTYDESGRAITSEIGGGIEKLTLSYGTNQTTVTDALNNATVYDHQYVLNMRRVKKVTGPCPSCGGGGGDVEEWTYSDVTGNIDSYKNGAGKIWTYTYNSNNELLTEKDPLDQVTTYTYDTQGRVLTRSGPDGSLTTYTHGPSGPLTITEKVTASTSRTTSITYHSTLGKPQAITDPRGKVTTLAYDPATGDLTSVTDPLSHATTFGYDTSGRRTTVTDALSHSTTTTYDAKGQVTRITSHDGTHTDFTYDLGGRRTKVIDPMGRVAQYGYDIYGRLAAVIDPMNGVTKYGYDVMSNLTSLTDAKGQTTAFEYDTHNRVKKVIYPGGASEEFTYDAAGRLYEKEDRKGVTTTFVPDALGRLKDKTYSNGEPAVHYTYDAGGRMQTAANGVDTLTWTYDLLGQVLSEASTKNASTVAYTYDLGGNRLSLSLDGTVFVSYVYDDASRLTEILRGSNVFGFGYNSADRRTSMTYPNGVSTAYTYDNLNRLLTLIATKGASTIASSIYTYDTAGNRLTKAHPEYTEAYKYDPLYRLTDVERTGIAKRQRYVYDPVGNRLSGQVDDTVTSYSYNNRNQLLSTTGGGTMRWRGTLNEAGSVTLTFGTANGTTARMLAGNVFEADVPVTGVAPGASGPSPAANVTLVATDTTGNTRTQTYSVPIQGGRAAFQYDVNGNLAGKQEGADAIAHWEYEWTVENELRRASEAARFAYDPLGRRVERLAEGVTTTWTYDGVDVLREMSATTTKYIHGPGIDEPLAMEDGAGMLTLLHADALGSVMSTSDSSGAVTAARRYDAWGVFEAGIADGHGFTGREWDAAVGLYYFRARYYDPSRSRFISEDPIGFRGGNNFYTYVGGNPLTRTDPSGLQESCSTGCATSPCEWHRACEEDSDLERKCFCHCAYAPDQTYCVDKCKECHGSNENARAACECACSFVPSSRREGCLKACRLLFPR